MIAKLKYHFIAIIALQLLLCFVYGYHKIYDSRPFSIHQWRQTDCASIAKNYFENGMDFLNPQIHWQGVENGKAVSEFPVINYSVALLYEIFGEKEMIYRLLVLIIFFISMLVLFYSIYIVGQSLMYSYFSIITVMSSPLLVYYSFNFLADVPALSFSIIALSLFIRFIYQKQHALFYLSIVFATLAALVKASSASVLLMIGIISTIDILNLNTRIKFSFQLFKTKLYPIVTFVISAIIIIVWYRFAFNYNGKNSNGVFLMDTLPIWKMNDKVIETARLLYNVQLNMFFNKGILFGFVIAAIWLLINRKKVQTIFYILFLVSAFSFFAFIVLFYQVFNVHDYYLITSMIFPVVILICYADYLKNMKLNINRKKMSFMIIIVLCFNTIHTAAIVRLRTVNKDNFCRLYPFISNDEKNFSDWFHYNYANTLKPLESITPYLRALGIQRNDFVVSIPDPSFNISLYLMDQKGFTETEETLTKDENKLATLRQQNVKYIILSDSNLIRLPAFQKVNMRKIGVQQNIVIYKLN
jgi:hypothetical protein